MNDQQAKDTVRNLFKAWITGDTEKVLSLFTDDSTWVTPQGSFKGLAEIKKYIEWVLKTATNYNITETGVGIIVQGDTALTEHDLSGVVKGEKWITPAICVWEFKGEKIKNLRTYYDVLAQAQQLAKGPMEKMAVNSIVKASREGLE